MQLHPTMFALWIDKFGNDYNVLRFILTSRHEAQVWKVLEYLTASKVSDITAFAEPGTDFEIYAKLIGNKPQPIPELKRYPLYIQQQYSTHPCWIRWAGIFDRPLTEEQRKILIHYRVAFTSLLLNKFDSHAEKVLVMAERPCTASVITGEFLYSKNILSGILLEK